MQSNWSFQEFLGFFFSPYIRNMAYIWDGTCIDLNYWLNGGLSTFMVIFQEKALLIKVPQLFEKRWLLCSYFLLYIEIYVSNMFTVS